eukprot:gene8569-10563_t
MDMVVMRGVGARAEHGEKVGATNPEEGMRHFTRATRALLGDPDAVNRSGALKPGETQFVVSGIFFIAPTKDHMILMADNGFSADQRHARLTPSEHRPEHGNRVVPDLPPAAIGFHLRGRDRCCGIEEDLLAGTHLLREGRVVQQDIVLR